MDKIINCGCDALPCDSKLRIEGRILSIRNKGDISFGFIVSERNKAELLKAIEKM